MPEKTKRIITRLAVLALNFILLFALYRIFIRLLWPGGTYLLYVAAAALFVAYFVMNRGLGKPVTDPQELPDEWTHKEKSDYIAKVTAAHERAKKLLYVLLPLVAVLMIDIISLFYFA